MERKESTNCVKYCRLNCFQNQDQYISMKIKMKSLFKIKGNKINTKLRGKFINF